MAEHCDQVLALSGGIGGAKLKVTLARPDDDLAPIQIRIEISWPDRTSQTIFIAVACLPTGKKL